MKPETPIAVVLDTNILYSALEKGGYNGKILEMVLEGKYLVACLSTALLLEYEKVLLRELDRINATRRKWKQEPVTVEQVDELLNTLTSAARLHQIYFRTRPSIENDKGDEFVVELAQAANAVLITKNLKHFQHLHIPYRLIIIHPDAVIEELFP